METKIQIFKSNVFGEVRTLTNEKGETFFVGKDVAEALGYSNSRDALYRHVDQEDRTTVVIHDGGHNTRVVVINESGLYSLILSSKLEQAKAFKRWVTSEVLPATMPLRRLMLDFDEKGHTDEIKARLMQKSPLVVLLIEESVRRGTHVLVELPF